METALDKQIAHALADHGAIRACVLAAVPDTLALYAFGSRIEGTARADSDLDLAILAPGYVEPVQLWELADALAEQAGCAVDLLDLRAASTVMQHQVLTQGRRLWAREPQAGLFECFVLSEKTALDAARSGLLDDIARRGSIHGR
jgi:Nucleotidyltransferase domain.